MHQVKFWGVEPQVRMKAIWLTMKEENSCAEFLKEYLRENASQRLKKPQSTTKI